MAMHTYIGTMATIKDLFNSCLFHSSAALARQLNRLANEQFLAFDLSPTQGFILITAHKAPGISVTDLAAVLSLDQSTVTKAREKMALKGLIQREPIGKHVRIFLTGEGEKREADAKAAWKKLRSLYNAMVGQAKAEILTTELTVTRTQLALRGEK